MKIVFIAGGKGTRIASVNNEIPKAMIPVNGKPVMEYQVELAKRYGYTDFIFVTGYLGDVIRRYFGDGTKWGVKIDYFQETSPLGTAGALRFLSDLLVDDFFVFYADTIMDIALDEMLAFHKKNNADATLLVHPNDHPYDSDIIDLDDTGGIKHIYIKPHPENFVSRNMVNASLFILSPKIIKYIPENHKSNFEKDVFSMCLADGLKMYGYVSFEYIKDMGTPDRYESVCKDVDSGRVCRSNRKNKQPAVFLDRDGVINREVNLLSDASQLELIPGAADAIRLINKAGYLAIVVTNQPVIARNLCSIDELNLIHDTLETKLGEEGAYLNAIYYCPHHPDGGYPEERKEYKVICECRKPKPGLLLKAADDWNIDMEASCVIGDKNSDVEAGINAGVKHNILIEQNKDNALLEAVKDIFGCN